MNFLESIFERLRRDAERPVLQEAREGRIVAATGGELLAAAGKARGFLNQAGLRKGDRCALLAHNGIRWAAMDLALMAEGVIVVPLYARQAPAELVAMMQDCSPSLLIVGDEGLRSAVVKLWPEAPRQVLLDEIFGADAEAGGGSNSKEDPKANSRADAPAVATRPLSGSDPVTIIYTSGTSGEAKGVVLTAGNLNHMLGCTTERLDQLMGAKGTPEQVFHYLPFCFAGSWILLLSCLTRHAVLTLSTDLTKLMDEMKLAAPEYFLNVPALLERVRAGIEEQMRKRGAIVRGLYESGKASWDREQTGEYSFGDGLALGLGRALVFPSIRKKLGPNLKALICGSAPLAKETQLFFQMLGIPVLQVYGLTETTAICTMDHPERIEPGRVGPAIPGIEMRTGENSEILVRGPNVFQGYWGRPETTAEVLRDGWFHTGDQGEVNGSGNWTITGRVKNLIIPSSGHNIAPEPIEEELTRSVPGAKQAVVVGNGRSFLAALITGDASRAETETAIEAVNERLPHYKRIHAFHLCPEPFTVDNGLLTVNGKLKRDAIARRYQDAIEEMYRKKESGDRSQKSE
jgi:long-chain acyl-CoA synthetase